MLNYQLITQHYLYHLIIKVTIIVIPKKGSTVYLVNSAIAKPRPNQTPFIRVALLIHLKKVQIKKVKAQTNVISVVASPECPRIRGVNEYIPAAIIAP